MSKRQLHPLDEKSGKVRSATIRKLGKDGNTFTPTEKRKRDRMLKQFSKQRKGYAVGVSEEYRAGYDAIDWSKK